MSEAFPKILPYLISGFTAFPWGGIYSLSANLYRMQSMFDPMLPFIIAKLLGFYYKSMPVLTGSLFAALDAGIIGEY